MTRRDVDEDDWFSVHRSRASATGDDYEIGIPTALLAAGAHDIDVTIAFGSASRGVFTNGGATCSLVK